MQRLITFRNWLLCSVVICATYHLQAQRAIDLGRSIFTLRNARATVGFLGQANTVGEENREPIFQIFTGTLPNDNVEIAFNHSDYPYLSGGIFLDFFSPNSIIGLTIGGEFNVQNFSLLTPQNNYDYQVNNLMLPAYLKFTFGKIHDKNNAFLSAGAFYQLPINTLRLKGENTEIMKGFQQGTLGLSMILGMEWRLTKEEAINVMDSMGFYTEYPRIWLFVRADHLLSGLFVPDALETILPDYTSGSFDYRTTNISAGLALFFGGKVRVK